MFSNQTGQFPTQSKQDKKYIMVMVEVDRNAILVKLLKVAKTPGSFADTNPCYYDYNKQE